MQSKFISLAASLELVEREWWWGKCGAPTDRDSLPGQASPVPTPSRTHHREPLRGEKKGGRWRVKITPTAASRISSTFIKTCSANPHFLPPAGGSNSGGVVQPVISPITPTHHPPSLLPTPHCCFLRVVAIVPTPLPLLQQRSLSAHSTFQADASKNPAVGGEFPF